MSGIFSCGHRFPVEVGSLLSKTCNVKVLWIIVCLCIGRFKAVLSKFWILLGIKRRAAQTGATVDHGIDRYVASLPSSVRVQGSKFLAPMGFIVPWQGSAAR